ncbi:MOB kinase activator-like 3 [Anopheles moucheti]|uniref:MOB kinase activator-like 3 n=1 Tax=Anopheles moucheti TaxID=186751 RepID=UPI0022EFE3B9|nr:MOB kinase activator-like 3 [Anopheles moucheti]
MALNGFLEFFQREKTFRPKKRFTQGTIRYSLHKQANASLQSGINLKEVVRLPAGENMNDWLAEAHVNTCYKHFYYFVTEFDLMSAKELEPLAVMTAQMCKD